MILNGVDPSQICLFTFTNKAANEMKERIRSAVGDTANQITCGTYHSIAHRLLRKYATHIGYNNNFTIMSSDDCKKLLNKIGKARNIDPDNLGVYISSKKDRVILPEKALINATTEAERALANAYSDYQTELKRQMAMDFDDLIVNTILLLRNNEEIKQRINNQWRYITAK